MNSQLINTSDMDSQLINNINFIRLFNSN